MRTTIAHPIPLNNVVRTRQAKPLAVSHGSRNVQHVSRSTHHVTRITYERNRGTFMSHSIWLPGHGATGFGVGGMAIARSRSSTSTVGL